MKQLKPSIHMLATALSAIWLFSGCEKEEKETAVRGIYIVPTSQAVSEEFKVSAASPYVRFAAAVSQPASGNVNAKIVIDNSLISAFNAKYKTAYLALPAGSVELAAENVTIAGGQMLSSKDSLKFNIAQLDPGTTYLLPLRVGQADGGGVTVVPAMAVKYCVIKVKPPYEGRYASSGTRFNFNSVADAPANPVSTSPWSFDTDVKWVSGSTYKVHAANVNGDFGTINITVNADNSVTVQANAETTLNALVQSPGKASTYDPAGKVFKLFYEYTNTTGTFRTVDHQLVLK